METAHPYQYDQLTEPGALRLIILQPDRDLVAAIRCSLVSTTLQTCHDDLVDKYTALSYVWGDARERKEILVDGTGLDITASLDLALRHVRDPVKIIRVWADGICINQQDVLERNKQVAQMGLIYEIANHTVIFLGLATEHSDILIRAINSVGLLSNEMYSKISLDYNRLNKALVSMLNYPWFTRVWTLQELVLSADPWIQCGSLRCRWDVLGKYIPWKKTSAMEDGMQPLRDMNRFRTSSLQGKYTPKVHQSNQDEKDVEALLSILHSRRGLGATDPRDFIFAHLGMISKEIRQAISIDYTRSCLNTYVEIARQILAWIPNLDILQMVETRNDSRFIDGLPSWVPDWSQSIKSVQPGTFIIGSESSPRTRSGSNYRVLHDSSKLLVVPVTFLGTVVSVLPSASERDAMANNQTPNETRVDSRVSVSTTSTLSDEDFKFQETMLYFFRVMLETTWDAKESDIVINTIEDHGQYLNKSQLSTLREVVSNIHSIRDKSLLLSDNGSKTNEAYAICMALLRITHLYLWVTPTRIALLSNGSLICIPNNTCEGDNCFVDPSAGMSYGERKTTTLFARKDAGFSMSEEDNTALALLLSQFDAKEGECLPSLDEAGPFQLLVRGEFDYVPSILINWKLTSDHWVISWKGDWKDQTMTTGVILL
ncbi:heterokaryon incompatibility protein-domain-containing protein, partial [Rhexocercosporidium sp. MPI-PUGE-AT-0058]